MSEHHKIYDDGSVLGGSMYPISKDTMNLYLNRFDKESRGMYMSDIEKQGRENRPTPAEQEIVGGTSLPQRYIFPTYQETFRVNKTLQTLDKDRIYKDKDGITWEFINGNWASGIKHEIRVARAGNQPTQPWTEFAPYVDVTVQELSKQLDKLGGEFKVYRDKEGDNWEKIGDFWYCAKTHAERHAEARRRLIGNLRRLWTAFAPYEEIKDPTSPRSDQQPLDESKVWTDRDGDNWEFINGRWVLGSDHELRASRNHWFGPNHLPKDYGPFVEADTEDVEEKKDLHQITADQSKQTDRIFADKDGDLWECIDGGWVEGETAGERREMREEGAGFDDLDIDWAPYTAQVKPEALTEPTLEDMIRRIVRDEMSK